MRGLIIFNFKRIPDTYTCVFSQRPAGIVQVEEPARTLVKKKEEILDRVFVFYDRAYVYFFFRVLSIIFSKPRYFSGRADFFFFFSLSSHVGLSHVDHGKPDHGRGYVVGRLRNNV